MRVTAGSQARKTEQVCLAIAWDASVPHLSPSGYAYGSTPHIPRANCGSGDLHKTNMEVAMVTPVPPEITFLQMYYTTNTCILSCEVLGFCHGCRSATNREGEPPNPARPTFKGCLYKLHVICRAPEQNESQGNS